MSANFNIVDLLKRRQPRQPWDERLPSGELPFNPSRQSGETEGITPPRQSPSPALQRTALGVPNNDILSLLKQQQPESANEGRVPDRMDQVRVGQSTAGMNDIDRQQAKVDLMRAAPAGQKVRQSGDFIEELPPEQSPSRVKNALVGLLLGTAQGGLPGGIAGAATGAIKPKLVQQMLKDKHVAREEEQLNSQLETEGRKAKLQDLILGPQIALMKAQRDAEYNAQRVKIQQDLEAGRITRAKAEEQQKELDRKSREQIAHDQIASRERIAKMRPNSEAAKDEERSRKASAAQSEFDQLVKDEAEAGRQKNDAYAYLEKIKAAAVNGPTGDIDAQSRMDIEQATRTAQEADKVYQSFAEKKRDAQTRMRENTVAQQATSQPYAGRTMSAANLAKYAKNKGISEDEARKQVEAQGVRVQ